MIFEEFKFGVYELRFKKISTDKIILRVRATLDTAYAIVVEAIRFSIILRVTFEGVVAKVESKLMHRTIRLKF